MNTADTHKPEVSERVEAVEVSHENGITFDLQDGRRISVPLSWSWRLSEATEKQMQNYRISPSGYGVHWPDLDEDISVRGMLRGMPAPRHESAPPPNTPSEWTPGRIKQLRKGLNMSQAEFAKQMGVSRQATISDWENGKMEPGAMARRLLDRIAGATGEQRERHLAHV